MDGNLGDILWQFAVVALLLTAGFIGVSVARRCRRWLRQRYEQSPAWAGLASLGVGLSVFATLAVAFGFVIDQTGTF